MRRCIGLVGVLLLAGALVTHTARADTSELFGRTLTCSYSLNGFPITMRVYVTKDRAFLYHAGRATPSKVGVVYDFGRERTGMVAGVNPYRSNAKITPGSIELNVALENRTCRICDGKIIMINDSVSITSRGNQWTATRNYRQSFPDGTQAAVPSGSDKYTCTVGKGRVGV